MNKNILKILIVGLIITSLWSIVVTIYAVAKKEKVKTTDLFVVSFDSDGGTFTPGQIVNNNTKTIKPEEPKKEGLNFSGWYLDTKEFNFDTKINKNITLKAKWTIPTYTIVFDSDGGSVIASQTIEKDSTVVRPSNPTKTGKEFVAWQLDGTNYDFNTKITKNITLKAIWQNPDTRLTVTFNSNGGTGVASQKVERNAKVVRPANPIKNGYTFIEWRLNGTTYNFNTAVTSHITLTATWRANPIVYSYSVEWIADSTSIVGQYYMYIKRSDGQRVNGTIKVNFKEGGSESVNVSTSGYKIIKDLVASAIVTSPTS